MGAIAKDQFKYKHGLSGHYLYKTWEGMLARCYRPNTKGYENYGGRGITVCERWRDSPTNFIYDMGERPDNHTLDRIDVDGNYEPNNCRWSSLQEQNRNKRRTYKNSSTDLRGITISYPRDEVGARYIVNKQVDGKRVYLGRYRTFAEADAALYGFIKGIDLIKGENNE